MSAQRIADGLALLARLFCGASIRATNLDMLRVDASQAGQRVYIANHSSHLDFIVLWAALPRRLRRVTRPVAAKDYWNKSPFRRYMAIHIYRAILIEREHISAHHNPIELIVQEMGDDSLILFPEGGRGEGEEIGHFKSGIYHLACKKPGLQCVPVYLENLNRILPKGEMLPLPLLSSLSFGEPIQLKAGENKNAFLGRLREAVTKLKDEMHEAESGGEGTRLEAKVSESKS